MFLLKMLSTAISNTYPWGDPEGEAPTWLCENCPIQFCDTETPRPPDDIHEGIPGMNLPAKKRTRQITVVEENEDEDEEIFVPLLQSPATAKKPALVRSAPTRKKSSPVPSTDDNSPGNDYRHHQASSESWLLYSVTTAGDLCPNALSG